jgi:formiminotetrahydrofolate cyclodeaminase
LRSAALNVYINAPSLKDRAFADGAVAEIEGMLTKCAQITETVFTQVRGRLG